MATYTASNAIKKIDTGDESGTWGDSTNNNADIIDRASNGYVSIQLPNGTNSYTLPLSTTAVLSLGHYKAIRFHGTPQGPFTVTLEQDNKPRVYMIYNNTNQTIIINQGTGNGAKVTIVSGDGAIVFADGAGANATVLDFTAQITGLGFFVGVSSGTVAASKAVVVDSSKDITGFRNVTATGTVTVNTLAIGQASIIESELEMIDGLTAGTVAASKAVVVNANKDVSSFRNLSATGTVTANTLAIGSASITESELERLDGITPGTVAALKTVTVDSNKDVSGFRNITTDNGGSITAGASVIAGANFSIGNAVLTETELERLDGLTAGTVTLNKVVTVNSSKDVTGFRNLSATGTITAGTLAIGQASIVEAELERLDGIANGTVTANKVVTVNSNKDVSSFRNLTATGTITAGTFSGGGLGSLSGVTAGTVSASKAVIVDGNKDVTGFRNLTMTGGTFTAGLSTFNLLASFSTSHGISCSSYKPPSGVNEVVNFLSSGGNQRLAFQMGALPNQTIHQNGTTLQLKTAVLSTTRELTYPNSSGTFATTDQTIGFGQTWTNLTSSRAASTGQSSNVYQAPIRTITVSLTGASNISFSIYIGTNANMSNEVIVASGNSIHAIHVPPNHYYRVTMSGSTTFLWAELR